MSYHFNEQEIPADMTEGDAIDFLRLTCKAQGLRRSIARWRAMGRRTAILSAALEAAKSDMTDISRRYA